MSRRPATGPNRGLTADEAARDCPVCDVPQGTRCVTWTGQPTESGCHVGRFAGAQPFEIAASRHSYIAACNRRTREASRWNDVPL